MEQTMGRVERAFGDLPDFVNEKMCLLCKGCIGTVLVAMSVHVALVFDIVARAIS